MESNNLTLENQNSENQELQNLRPNTISQNVSPPYAMYIFVNNDLKMDKGKIAGQVGHIVQKIIETIFLKINFNTDDESKKIIEAYTEWRTNGMAKIVLKATQAELEEILAKNDETHYVRDLGLTQIAPNSLTAVGFYPALKSEMYDLVKNFKLL